MNVVRFATCLKMSVKTFRIDVWQDGENTFYIEYEGEPNKKIKDAGLEPYLNRKVHVTEFVNNELLLKCFVKTLTVRERYSSFVDKVVQYFKQYPNELTYYDEYRYIVTNVDKQPEPANVPYTIRGVYVRKDSFGREVYFGRLIEADRDKVLVDVMPGRTYVWIYFDGVETWLRFSVNDTIAKLAFDNQYNKALIIGAIVCQRARDASKEDMIKVGKLILAQKNGVRLVRALIQTLKYHRRVESILKRFVMLDFEQNLTI